jgi:hypothetical protein
MRRRRLPAQIGPGLELLAKVAAKKDANRPKQPRRGLVKRGARRSSGVLKSSLLKLLAERQTGQEVVGRVRPKLAGERYNLHR